jgi:hypothetical protein
MECKAADLLSLLNVINVDIGSSLRILGALTNSKVFAINCHGHAGELNSRVAEDRLFTSFSVLDNKLVVESEIGETSLWVPH